MDVERELLERELGGGASPRRDPKKLLKVSDRFGSVASSSTEVA